MNTRFLLPSLLSSLSIPLSPPSGYLPFTRRASGGVALVLGCCLMVLQAVPASAQTVRVQAGCTGFEKVTAGSNLTVGDSFGSGDIQGRILEFTQRNGAQTSDGFARTTTSAFRGRGKALFTDNASLGFSFSKPVKGVSFAYVEAGGSVAFSVNEEERVAPDLSQLHGETIGGTSVVVRTGPGGSSTGVVVLRGPVDELIVGGQELAVDDLCFGCITFEDLSPGSRYPRGDQVRTGGYVLDLERFTTEDGRTLAGRGLEIADPPLNSFRRGNKGFSGSVIASPRLSARADTVSFLYEQRGGQINLRVNEELRATSNSFSSLDGQVVDGARIHVQTLSASIGAYSAGKVTITGEIREFAVGGQELLVDDICICSL